MTPGVLVSTHKAFRDIDSPRLESGSRGLITAATCCVRARLFSAAPRRSIPSKARNRGMYRSLHASHCSAAVP